MSFIYSFFARVMVGLASPPLEVDVATAVCTFGTAVDLPGSSVPGRRKWFVRLRVRPAFSKFSSILNYTVY